MTQSGAARQEIEALRARISPPSPRRWSPWSSGRATVPEPGEPPRILVVDDDPRVSRFVRDVLSEAGFDPLVTGAPQEMPRIIRTERPRLVLLDLMLPDTDGIELMGQVPELADLPVIFISGYGRDETVAKALESGAADYLVKPFSPTELVARIRAALRRRERGQPRLPVQRARRRLPHGEAAGSVRPIARPPDWSAGREQA